MSDVAYVSNARVERKVGPLRIAYFCRAVSSLIWFLVVVTAVAHSRSSVEQALGERLAHEYEKRLGLEGPLNWMAFLAT